MIAGVVLAAGGSARLGRPKQLLELGGAPPLVRRAAMALIASGCTPVVVVVGAHEVAVRGALSGVDANCVVNPEWRLGMAGSIRRAIAELQPRAEVEGVVLAVTDQPALSSAIVTRLIETWRTDPRRRVACRYAGSLGVPAVFGREVFPDLLRLEGDRGAKQLLAGHESTVGVDWEEGAFDVDEPGDADPRRNPEDPPASPERGPEG